PHSANGTRMKPANVVSLNSKMVMKSWTASTKNDSTTMNHAPTRTRIVTKCVKTVVKPSSLPACCTSGYAAVKPVPASLPGRSKSAADMPPPDAVKPSCEKELKISVASVWKLLMM